MTESSESKVSDVCVCPKCRRDEFVDLLRQQLKLSKLKLRMVRRPFGLTISNGNGAQWMIGLYHGQDPWVDSVWLGSRYPIDEAQIKSHLLHVLAVMRGKANADG